MRCYYHFRTAASTLLVSTYVVCERLSVMHEPAGVVEILVQILQFTPYSEVGTEYHPPQMKIVRVQIQEFQNTPYSEVGSEYPHPHENCQSPNPRVSEYPPPRLWKFRSPNPSRFRIPPPPPRKWKLSESPNPRVSEYPCILLSRFRIPPHPPKWKLSESLNPRVSEYPLFWTRFRIPPPKMKIVRESKSKSFRIPPILNKIPKIQTKLWFSNFRIV